MKYPMRFPLIEEQRDFLVELTSTYQVAGYVNAAGRLPRDAYTRRLAERYFENAIPYQIDEGFRHRLPSLAITSAELMLNIEWRKPTSSDLRQRETDWKKAT